MSDEAGSDNQRSLDFDNEKAFCVGIVWRYIIFELRSMNMNEDDLYDDLEHAVAKPSSNSKATTAQTLSSATKNKIHSTTSSFSVQQQPINTTLSQTEITQLQQQVESLKAENDILKKNIGILYRTAKSELQRKDKTICQLQDEVDSPRR